MPGGSTRIPTPWMALKQDLLGILFTNVAPLGHGLLQVANIGERPSANQVVHCTRSHGICRVERNTSGRRHPCSILKIDSGSPVIACYKRIANSKMIEKVLDISPTSFSAGTVISHIPDVGEHSYETYKTDIESWRTIIQLPTLSYHSHLSSQVRWLQIAKSYSTVRLPASFVRVTGNARHICQTSRVRLVLFSRRSRPLTAESLASLCF